MIPCSYQRLNKPRVVLWRDQSSWTANQAHWPGHHHLSSELWWVLGFHLGWTWVVEGGCFGNRQHLTWNQEGTRRHDRLMKLMLDCEGTMPMQARVPNCPRCVCDSPVLGDIVYTSRGSYLVQNAIDEVFLPRSPAPSRFWGSDLVLQCRTCFQ